MRFPPANLQLRRAQLVLMLAVLMPTVLMIGIGIVLLAIGSNVTSIVLGALILAGCSSGVAGYIVVSILVGKGASLARVQNDFVSSVSHELRTPLTSIRLLLEALNADRLSADEKRRVLDLLAQETQRLESLVNRVIELSKIETGTIPADRSVIAIADVCTDAIAVFNAATLSNPTKIAVDLEPGLSCVGDRSMLARAVANLLINAWKYTGPDKQISMRGKRNGRWTELSVIDNGIGIDRNEQKAVFEQFFRGKSAQTNGAPGVGLGLAFVRAIVRAQRGKIEVHSAPNGAQGTEFRLRLRQNKALQATSNPVPPQPSHVSQQP